MHVATAVVEILDFFLFHDTFQHKLFWRTSDIYFSESSSNGKEAFQPAVDS